MPRRRRKIGERRGREGSLTLWKLQIDNCKLKIEMQRIELVNLHCVIADPIALGSRRARQFSICNCQFAMLGVCYGRSYNPRAAARVSRFCGAFSNQPSARHLRQSQRSRATSGTVVALHPHDLIRQGDPAARICDASPPQRSSPAIPLDRLRRACGPEVFPPNLATSPATAPPWPGSSRQSSFPPTGPETLPKPSAHPPRMALFFLVSGEWWSGASIVYRLALAPCLPNQVAAVTARALNGKQLNH
jgi:hypothetical protein